jgi:dTDP-4-amino-4,6-dideoxygalactose transaminase
MIFSFYPTKPIGSIDGGMIVSNDANKISWFKEACLNGMTQNENNWERMTKFSGWKMYMNSFQADIAMKNFKKLENKNYRLDEIRIIYNQEFGIQNTSRHLYRLFIKNREEFFLKMKQHDISCGIHYRAAHMNSIYGHRFYINGDLPCSEMCNDLTVSIPYHEALTKQEINKVIELVKQCAQVDHE